MDCGFNVFKDLQIIMYNKKDEKKQENVKFQNKKFTKVIVSYKIFFFFWLNKFIRCLLKYQM